ncbi:MAG: efflux RND transporter periplasmic adaptor subunit [Rubripirellula sp.]
MRVLVRLLILAIFLGGLGTAAHFGRAHWEERNQPKFRTNEITEGDIIAVVNSTGEVKPVLSVSVGSFVSGPIQALHVDFNDEVSKGQLMAEIDPRIYQASVAGDKAVLAIRRGEVNRVEADLGRAIADEKRANELQKKGAGYVSQVEVDQFRYARQSLEAQRKVAEAGVAQAEAALENSQANLGYTRIVSPVDGIVIDRKIEPGQTLAAQFQTPELFVVAPDIREKMHIFASVDEADIGLIRTASKENQPVEFTVDAYPDELFAGEIEEIRLSPVITQNVVTYPVVVSASNPDLKLMPGMTASLSFRIEQRQKCSRLPNAALRFFPQIEHVREQDKPIITGISEDEESDAVVDESAVEKTTAAVNKSKRYVWVFENKLLRAVEVTIGIRDSRWTEMLGGELKVGDDLVVAEKKD